MLGSEGCYCQHCFDTRPRCSSCSAPLADKHWRLHDGRLQCARCHHTAIYDPALALLLYGETIAGVATDLELILNVGVDFRMVDMPTLNGMRQQRTADETTTTHHGTGTDAETPRTLGLYVRRGHLRVIYMLHGVPRLIFRTTVAHEFAHAWQTEHCPLLSSNNDALREGFAEWVAYHHLRWLGAHKAAQRMLVANHPYRPYLDYVLSLEQQLGREGVIDYIKRAE